MLALTWIASLLVLVDSASASSASARSRGPSSRSHARRRHATPLSPSSLTSRLVGRDDSGSSSSTNQTFKYVPPANRTLDPVAATWFAGWHASNSSNLSTIFTPADLFIRKYTTIKYAFAETTNCPTNLSFSDEDAGILTDLVERAHAKNVTVAISVGGWTGSQYFSTNVGSAANRTQFVNTLTSFVNAYDLDGIDFDWEYPNVQGLGCNAISGNDTANFLLLLQELRASSDLASNATLSAAVNIVPFADSLGVPLKDVSEFAEYLDYIEIMNYDIWGPWSTTSGPNAPLNDTCATGPYQGAGSAVSALTQWTGAGFPADQIVLGVASYGHSFSVNPADAFGPNSNFTTSPVRRSADFLWSAARSLVGSGSGSEEGSKRSSWSASRKARRDKKAPALVSEYLVFNKSNQPIGDSWDDPAGVDACGLLEPQGGLFTFWGLIQNNFLDDNGEALSGISYNYDNCSQTPSVYNATSQVLVEYDDATSFEAKGAFIADNGLRGFSMWEAGGDYEDILLDAIRDGAGFPELTCEDDEEAQFNTYGDL